MTSRFKIKIMRASCHPNCQSKKTLRQQETVAHLCNLPRQPFILPFAIRLKTLEQLSLRVSSERASERAPHGRSRLPSIIHVWNDHLLVVRFHDAAGRGRDEESSDSSAASHRDTCISSSKRRSSGQLFFHLVPRLPGGERERASGGHRERDLFHRRYTFTFTSPPRCFLSPPPPSRSLSLSPHRPLSLSIRSPRSAYLREIHRATQSLRRLAKVSLRLSPAGSALLLFAPLFVVRPSPSLPSRAVSRRPRTDFWLINEPHPSTPSITSSWIVDGTMMAVTVEGTIGYIEVIIYSWWNFYRVVWYEMIC